jgi:hypothetical protein
VDGRRRNSDDEPRWDRRGYRDPTWPEPAPDRDTRPRDEGHHVPEPRASGPNDTSSFDGFATGPRPWEQPTYDGDDPSWTGGPAAQVSLPIPPPSAPQSAPPGDADASRPQSGLPGSPRPESGPPYDGQVQAYGGRPQSAPPFGSQPQGETPFGGPPQSEPPFGGLPLGPPAFGAPDRPVSPSAPSPGSGVPAADTPTGAMPPVDPRDEPPRFHTEPLDRSGLRRPATNPAGDGVYRTRRPAAALLYGVLALVFEFVAIRIFLDGMFGGPFLAGQTMAGLFLIAGLPLLGIGLYGATTGAGRPDNWLRAPGVYLLAGGVLLISAGLAG